MFKKLLLIVCSSILLLAACGKSPKESNKTNANTANNQIINKHGNVNNLSRMDIFIKNINSGKSDEITITHYTIEGDPIYDKVHYEGNKLTITNDNTEDKFGSPQITTYTCNNLSKQESETKLEYMLQNCILPDGSRGSHPVLSIDYNLPQQDYFAFRLEYGINRKSIIDTKKQEIIKDLQNGQFMAIQDFQFSEKDMQEIYKLMVLAGYLGEKKLATTCKEKSEISYKLKVWINSGEREFEWNQCDNSNNGKQMTELAEAIVEILKKTETYKNLKDMNS